MVRVIAATLAAVAGLELSAAQYTGQTCVAIRDGNNIGNCAFPFDANGNGESTVCAPDGSNPRWCSIAYDYVSTDWGICQCSCNAGYSEIVGYTNNGEPGTGHCKADTDDLNDEGEINDINDLVRMLQGPSDGPATTMPMAPAPSPMASSGPPMTTAAPDEREEHEEDEEHEHEEPEEDNRPEWVEYDGPELAIGSACRNNGFTPNMTLSFTCSGLTSDDCCSMEGRNEERGGEEGSVCQFDRIGSADDYAALQTQCTDPGGTGAVGGTCTNEYPRDFPGVDWCQRRRCEHCGHTWAEEFSWNRAVTQCCGGQGNVCDEADSGGASVESVCTNADDFMPDLVLENECVGVTEEACCGLGGHFRMEGHNDCIPEGMGICRMETGATPAPAPATSSNNNATTMAPDTANSTTTPASSSRRLTQQEACAAAGGTFQPTESTCEQRLMHARGWGGVDTCADRVADERHSVADEIRDRMIRQGCCGSSTFVCDPASEGGPADWCETPADWTPDFVHQVNCRGLTQAECCDAGGYFENRGEDTCGHACRFERERSTDPDPMETCTSAGGTVERTETCASLVSHIGGFPGSAQCDARARPNSDDDSTVANYASHVGSMCCGQTRSNVCGASSSPSEDLCQDPDSFMASASHNVKCMGITEAACRTLHREQCPTDTVDMSLCLGRMEFEGADDSEGCGTTECEYVTSVGSDTAEDRCVAAGGTVRQAESCDSWAQGAIGHIGPFARFAQGSTTRPTLVDCGGFLGEENINYHMFLAGSACCSDGYSQCMGVDVHVVSASMTLGITFPANMSEGQLQDAVIASIAAQTGLNASRGEIGNVTVTVKVVGTAPMVVADPAAFIASIEAKMAVEAGLAAKVGVDASSVTATLSLEDGSAAAPASAPASAPATAPASAPSSSANSTTTTPVSRRLQSGTVNVAYEIEADMASSAMMTADLGATDGAALLTAAINEQLENVTGIDAVEVETLTAEPQVTITYEIRTTDAAAARTAQATMAAAASSGTGQDALLGDITQALADAGYAVTISSMSADVEEVQTVEQGDAPPSRPSSNSAFRSGHRDVAAAVAVAVAVAAAL